MFFLLAALAKLCLCLTAAAAAADVDPAVDSAATAVVIVVPVFLIVLIFVVVNAVNLQIDAPHADDEAAVWREKVQQRTWNFFVRCTGCGIVGTRVRIRD
jgi:uncharacterized membrane protein